VDSISQLESLKKIAAELSIDIITVSFVRPWNRSYKWSL